MGLAMALEKKITFVGAGNMATAILGGLVKSGGAAPENIWATDPRQESLDALHAAHGIHVGRDNKEAVAWADVVVLATKPQVFDRVLSPNVQTALAVLAMIPLIIIGYLIRKHLGRAFTFGAVKT